MCLRSNLVSSSVAESDSESVLLCVPPFATSLVCEYCWLEGVSEALVTVVGDKVSISTPTADKLRFRVCGGSQSDQDSAALTIGPGPKG